MHLRHALGVLCLSTIASTLPVAAGAQIAFGGALGANVPVADYGGAAKAGLVLNGFVQLGVLGSPALRGELFWSRSDIDNPLIRDAGGVSLGSDVGDVTGTVDLVGGSVDVVVPVVPGPLQPYLIGGLGVFRRRVSQDVEGAVEEFDALRRNDTDLGFNGGIGLRFRLLALAPFIEARYYSVGTSPERTNFIPVTLGLAF